MDIENVKRLPLVVAVFGGNDDSDVALAAESLGAAIAMDTQWIVLTGGVAPRRNSPFVKERALVGPDTAGRPWIGIPKGRDSVPTLEPANGLLIRSSLGNRRNYLEAMLCVGAIALKGGSGTRSEATSVLCLGKPVVLVGEYWSGAHFDREVRREWVEGAETKFSEQPSIPAIDELIKSNVNAERLEGAESRCAQVNRWDQAIEALAGLLNRMAPEPSHA